MDGKRLRNRTGKRQIKLGGTRQELDRLENELKMVSSNLTKGDQMEKILNDTFKQIEDITDVHEMTNVQIKRLIKKIEVDKDGNVDIYLRLLGDLGLNESILVEDECKNKTNLNSNDQTLESDIISSTGCCMIFMSS